MVRLSRDVKHNLFKRFIYTCVVGTFLVFVLLFSSVLYKGIGGLFERTLPCQVNFVTHTPHAYYQLHKDHLRPGALKHLYDAYHKNPHFEGLLSLPSRDKAATFTFAKWFFSYNDSRYAESAGLWGALWGSLYVLLITLITALPIGLCAGIYLEELAPRHGLLSLLEIIIANLAAVPSILYGLLGLAMFIHACDMPRSSALVGGLTLALMSLPLLVTSTRQALRTVPQSLRDSAKALGASPLQATFHHVVPYAFPPIMTGIFISMARVLGETAPLLIVGLMIFNPGASPGFMNAATTLPMQIFMWSRHPEPQFIAKAAAAILVLILFLAILTLMALKFRRTHDRS